MRKLIIAVLSIVVFTIIQLATDNDPFQTGLGIAAFVGVIMYGYDREYKNGIKSEKS